MRAILFVDDEPALLHALRRALYRERSRWKLVFVTSAALALEAIEREPFDMVVSDLKMPDMDGIELLGRVRAKQPATVRVILTGNIEHAVTAGLAQETLAKPCSAAAVMSCLGKWFPEGG